MTIIRTLIISLSISILCFFPVLADEAFDIQKFATDIQINQDSTLTVIETIDINFTENKHGIFRDIQDKGISIKVLGVTDANNKKYKYKKQSFSEGVRLKIGDPDTYVNGDRTYKISYTVKKAIQFFESSDELYWNATGNEWPVNIKEAIATVTLPQAISVDKLQFKCYTGKSYSTIQDCTYQYDSLNNKITFKSDSALSAYNGLTIVAGLPKGILIKPVEITDYWWFKLMISLAIALSAMIALEPVYTFWQKGRDPKGRGTIIPEYEAPDKLCPAEVGTLVDEKVHAHDLSSTIVDLAVRGYLKIKVLKDAKGLLFKKDDYELNKIENPILKKNKRQGLTKFEEDFMKAVFGSDKSKKVSDMFNKFYTKLPKLKESLYKNLVKKEYFPKSPNAVRNKYFIKGGVILGILFFTPFIGFLIEPLLDNEVFGIFVAFLAIGIVINGLLSLAFANFMPCKTKKGVLARESVLGLKHYMEIAEKDRLKFQEKENIFYELLPYAMALQIVGRWSRAFDGVFKDPPDWYEGHHGTFLIGDFTNSISTMSGSISTAFTSSPSGGSGGSGFSGGFSGGGFGGGGGGSW